MLNNVRYPLGQSRSAGKNLIYLFVAFAIIFTSCGKKEEVKKDEPKDIKKEESKDIPPGATCEIDGKPWKADSTSYIVKRYNSLPKGQFEFREYEFRLTKDEENSAGQRGDIHIYIKSELKVGEYNLATYESKTHYAEFNAVMHNYNSTDGKLIITKVDDKHAEGTFYFNSKEMGGDNAVMKFTNGKFNLVITFS